MHRRTASTESSAAPLSPTARLLSRHFETGGGREKALGRHAVAALLNASSSDVSYEYSVSEVINLVRDAWSGAQDIQDVENVLAGENEMGCPSTDNPPLLVEMAVVRGHAGLRGA